MLDSSQGIKKQNHPSLTGLRVIAAYMVFIHHNNFFPPDFLGGILYRMAKELHLGVGVFFVLSGFLIYYTYADIQPSLSSYISYMRKRFARIYPVYFLILVITIVAGAYSSNLIISVFNLTLTQAFFEQIKFSGIGQSWSLTVELCFYTIAPLLFILHRRGIRLMTLWAPIIMIGIILVGINSFISYLFGGWQFMLIYTFFGRVTEFFIGIITAKIVLGGQLSQKKHLTTISIALLVLIIFFMSTLSSHEYQFGVFHPLGIVLNNIIFPIFVSLLIIGLIREETFIKKVLSSRLLVLLGSSSYVFYLIHMGVFRMAIDKYILNNTLLAFVILNLLSILIYSYYERPLYNAISRRKTNQSHA